MNSIPQSGESQSAGRGRAIPADPRIVKAAREFEALLVGSLLRSLEATFSASPGQPVEAGGDDYQYMATQALASALSERGGLGLARLVIHQMEGTKVAVDPATRLSKGQP